MKVIGILHAPAAVPPGIEGWVDPTASLDPAEKRKKNFFPVPE
jgi:hypothetical protein